MPGPHSRGAPIFPGCIHPEENNPSKKIQACPTPSTNKRTPTDMKKLITAIAASTALIGSLHAGPPVTIEQKQVAPVEVYYGTGWYGALQGGVNAYQSL